jgi:hypothetical protein
MNLVSRLKERVYNVGYFALGFAEEQAASTFGSAPFNIARRHNILPFKSEQSDWNRQIYRQRQEAEQRGFATGAVTDVALLLATFTPVFGDNPRLARYAAVAVGAKVVGQVLGFIYNKVDRYRSNLNANR